MSDSNRLPSASRRGFAKSLALAAAAPALAGAAIALGQTAPAPTPSPALTPVPTPEAPSSVAEATFFLSVAELSKKLKAKQISPVALAEGYLERLERIGPTLGAVVTVTRERALQEAKAAEAEILAGKWRGPLHGIPYGVKDLLATKGIPTTWGAEPYRNQVFDEDATVVTKLREAGAVLLGKLAMVELAGGFGYNSADASFTGPGRTPWNTDFWSGGSSSGPGAATAAGLVGLD